MTGIRISRAERTPRDVGRIPRALARLLMFALLVYVQGPLLTPLLVHASCTDQCEDAAADCHPFGSGDSMTGCDVPCSCPGCPIQVVSLVQLDRPIDIRQPLASRTDPGSAEGACVVQVPCLIFRPPCA